MGFVDFLYERRGFISFLRGRIAENLKGLESNVSVEDYLSMDADEQREYIKRLTGRDSIRWSSGLSRKDIERFVSKAID